jgi:hypothetical protein
MKLDFCAACGNKKNLNQHHLIPRENLIVTLCSICHGRVHNYCGPITHVDLIKQGHARARSKGKKLGGPLKYVDKIPEMQQLLLEGKSLSETARIMNIPLSSIRNYLGKKIAGLLRHEWLQHGSYQQPQYRHTSAYRRGHHAAGQADPEELA